MRTFYLTFFWILFINSTSYSQMKDKADLILTNSKIFTLNNLSTQNEAIAVIGGKIAGIGKNSDILSQYVSENIIDAAGKPVYPGFIDAHCHFYGYALSLQQVNLTGTGSFVEIIELLKRDSADFPGEWLIGRGWDQNDWNDKVFPDRKELDRLFPHRPVVLIRIDGHVALANGEALIRAGIGSENNFQPGEVEIKNGWLTGILSENATDHIRNSIPLPDRNILILLLKKAQMNCFAVGLTTVADAGLEYENIRLIEKLQKEHILNLRIYAMLSPSEKNVTKFVEKGIYQNDYLNIRSIKLYADGSLGSRTALLKSPYSDQPDKTGILVTSVDSIRKLCRTARKYGYQVNTHAIGDSAVRLVLKIYSEFLDKKNDLRWRIEHSQVVDPSDFYFFKKYSVIPSIQATHATSDMYWAGDRLGKNRIKWAYAYNDLLQQNGWLANGTDFPIENISPFLTFYASVARKDIKGWPEKGFQTENALPRQEALNSITIWAAKSCFEENLKGSIEVGKFADFIILDRDLMTAPEVDIPKIKVLKTFIGGELVYQHP